MTPPPVAGEKAYVVDASCVIPLLVPEAHSDRIDALFESDGSSLYAPSLLLVECANVLWKYVRRHKITLDEARGSLADLQNLGILLVPTEGLLKEAFNWATEAGITVYDACYAALAEALSAPVVTADHALAEACRARQCSVLTPDELPLGAPPEEDSGPRSSSCRARRGRKRRFASARS